MAGIAAGSPVWRLTPKQTFPESESFDCAFPLREVDQQGRYIACKDFPLRKIV